MEEINGVLGEVCKITVMAIAPQSLGRFYHLLQRGGGKDRCLYRMVVTARPDDLEFRKRRISDRIDQAFLRADPHAAHRAKKALAMVKRLLSERKQ
jgi:hypothetical protein